MTTWTTLRGNVRRLIKDNTGPNYKVGDGELLAYANYGLDWMARRHPAQRTSVVPLVERMGSLPDDLLLVTGVYAATNGVTRALEESDAFQPNLNEYTVLTRTLLKVGDPGLNTVALFYDGLYPAIAEVEAEEPLPIPRWLEEALFYFVGSRAMSQRASDMSTINQWDSKNDSGNPEHNPMLQVARQFEELAERALNRPGGHA